MRTVTIPKKIFGNDDLVILPRKVFESMQDSMMPVKKVRGRAARRIDARVREGKQAHASGATEPFSAFIVREHPELKAAYER